MQVKAVKKAIDKRLKKLEKPLLKVGNDFADDNIHSFRVAYKKLRAMLRLIAHKTGDDGKQFKMPGSMKKLYQAAGEIRDIALEIDAVQQQAGELPEWVTEKRAQLAALKLKWQQADVAKAIKKLHKRTEEIHESVSAYALHQFAQSRLRAIEEITRQPTVSDEDLHTLRKNFKDLLYSISAVGNNNDDETLQSRMEAIDDVAGLIGDYNDKRLLLEDIMTKGAPTADDEKLRDLAQRTKTQLQTDRKVILDRITALLVSKQPPATN